MSEIDAETANYLGVMRKGQKIVVVDTPQYFQMMLSSPDQNPFLKHPGCDFEFIAYTPKDKESKYDLSSIAKGVKPMDSIKDIAAYIQENKVEGVLSGLGMPDYGIELTETLRKNNYKGAIVLQTAGQPYDYEVRKAKESGASGLYSKENINGTDIRKENNPLLVLRTAVNNERKSTLGL